jgi:hypothetical protein
MTPFFELCEYARLELLWDSHFEYAEPSSLPPAPGGAGKQANKLSPPQPE